MILGRTFLPMKEKRGASKKNFQRKRWFLYILSIKRIERTWYDVSPFYTCVCRIEAQHLSLNIKETRAIGPMKPNKQVLFFLILS